jgi:hypothetical protein
MSTITLYRVAVTSLASYLGAEISAKPLMRDSVDEIAWHSQGAVNATRWHSRRYGEEPFTTKRHAKDRRGSGKAPLYDKIYSPSLSIFGIGTHYSIWGAIRRSCWKMNF